MMRRREWRGCSYTHDLGALVADLAKVFTHLPRASVSRHVRAVTVKPHEPIDYDVYDKAAVSRGETIHYGRGATRSGRHYADVELTSPMRSYGYTPQTAFSVVVGEWADDFTHYSVVFWKRSEVESLIGKRFGWPCADCGKVGVPSGKVGEEPLTKRRLSICPACIRERERDLYWSKDERWFDELPKMVRQLKRAAAA